VRQHADDGQLVELLYLQFLSRYPRTHERDTAVAYLQRTGGDGRTSRPERAEDLCWSLLNSLEFIFNH
jgi:hypothetical protein